MRLPKSDRLRRRIIEDTSDPRSPCFDNRLPLRDEVAPGIKFPGWKPNRKLGMPLVLASPTKDERSGVYFETLLFSRGPVIRRALTQEEADRRLAKFHRTILEEETRT